MYCIGYQRELAQRGDLDSSVQKLQQLSNTILSGRCRADRQDCGRSLPSSLLVRTRIIVYKRYSHVIPGSVMFPVYSAGTFRGWGSLYLTSTLFFPTSYLCKVAVSHGVNGKVAQQGNSGKARRQQQNKCHDCSEELWHSRAGLSVILLLRTMYRKIFVNS